MSRPDSARHAQAILDAWKRRDTDGFTHQLEQTVAFCALPGGETGEAERRELLAEVAGEMLRGIDQRPGHSGTDASGVCLDLLRHLAGREHHRSGGPLRPAARPPMVRRGARFACQPLRAGSFAGSSRHSSI
jgi:hypothetical protein